LADALEPLLVSSTLRREVGQAGRERFMREFTDLAMQRRFFASLEAIVQNHDREDESQPDRHADNVASA